MSTTSQIYAKLSVDPQLSADGIAYHRFNVIHQILEVDESQLGFEMRVFSQVSDRSNLNQT
jgi:hypothetical protein